MIPAQDHKRIFNNDMGPNTGGMGAYCPCPLINKDNYEIVKSNILQKAIDGLKQEQIPFVGLYYNCIIYLYDHIFKIIFNIKILIIIYNFRSIICWINVNKRWTKSFRI